MSHLRKRLAFWQLAVASIAGCSDDPAVTCNALAVYGLDATVVNGLDTSGQCAVSVVAVDGSYVETLVCSPESTGCRCKGASERAGTYEVTATRIDGALVSKTVTVGRNVCHVESISFTLELP